MTGPREDSRTASAISASSGESTSSRNAETTMSNVRLTKKSTPSKTGGRSSNSGTDAPGHELRALDEDLHRRGRDAHGDAALMARVDEVDRELLGEVGVGDDHFLDAVDVEHAGHVLDPAQRAQPVVRTRRERDEADHLHRRVHLIGERVRDVLDVTPGADQHRSAAVAGGAQDRARHLLVQPASRAQDRHGEDERAVEDVVARVLLVVDHGEDQRDDRHLEQRGDDASDPRALGPLGVQAGAREQQHGHEVGERDRPPRLVDRLLPGPHAVAQDGLDHQRDDQRRQQRRRNRAPAARRPASRGAASPSAAGRRAPAGACDARPRAAARPCRGHAALRALRRRLVGFRGCVWHWL